MAACATISWLHRAPSSTYTNTLNATCRIYASRITKLFLGQYGLVHLPQILADGNGMVNIFFQRLELANVPHPPQI